MAVAELTAIPIPRCIQSQGLSCAAWRWCQRAANPRRVPCRALRGGRGAVPLPPGYPVKLLMMDDSQPW